VRIPGTNLQGWRAIAVGALGLYIVLFIVLNNRRLEVNFVFFKIRSHELLALLVIVLLGFAAGLIVGDRRQRRRSSQAQRGSLESSSQSTTPPLPHEGEAVGRSDGPASSHS
jgi:uncharacterized integral membrane protein